MVEKDYVRLVRGSVTGDLLKCIISEPVVTIEKQQVGTERLVDSPIAGRAEANVGRIAQQTEAPVPGRIVSDHLGRAVGRAIIDTETLEVSVGLGLNRGQALANHLLCVENGDDD